MKPDPRTPRGVVLYSGGMDSVILAAFNPQALRLYVNVNSAYSAKEMGFLPHGVQVDHSLNLRKFEREDAIIPGRNLMLALIAAQYGQHIMLGATAGDASRDKDDNWADMATGVLRYMFSGKHFGDQQMDMRVLLPLRGHDKAELIRVYLAQGHDPKALLYSVSCYHPEHRHCGTCKSCMRKWVAFEDVGIPQPLGYWHHHPMDANWVDTVEKLNAGVTVRGLDEDNATRRVLARNGWHVVLPGENKQ